MVEEVLGLRAEEGRAMSVFCGECDWAEPRGDRSSFKRIRLCVCSSPKSKYSGKEVYFFEEHEECFQKRGEPKKMGPLQDPGREEALGPKFKKKGDRIRDKVTQKGGLVIPGGKGSQRGPGTP